MDESKPETVQPKIWNLPNILTIARIVMVPILIYFMLQEEDALSRWLALIVFCVAAYTDRIDGNLARKNKQITNFGKIADPIADKLLVLGSFITLSFLDIPYWWFTITVIVRELAVTGLRMYLLKQSIVVPASKGGKWKTAFQMLLIFMILLAKAGQWYLYDYLPVAGPDYVMPIFRWSIDIVMVIAFVITVLTGLQYFLDAMENAKDAKEGKDESDETPGDLDEVEDRDEDAEDVLEDIDDIEELDPEVAEQLAQAQKEAELAEAELAVLEAELALLEDGEGDKDSDDAEKEVSEQSEDEEASRQSPSDDEKEPSEADEIEDDQADNEDLDSGDHDEETQDSSGSDSRDREEEPAVAIIDVSDDDITTEDSEEEVPVEDSESESDVDEQTEDSGAASSESADDGEVESEDNAVFDDAVAEEDGAETSAHDDEAAIDIPEEIRSKLPSISRRDRKRMVRDARRKGIVDPEAYVDKQLIKAEAEAMEAATNDVEDDLELQNADSNEKTTEVVTDESVEDSEPKVVQDVEEPESDSESENSEGEESEEEVKIESETEEREEDSKEVVETESEQSEEVDTQTELETEDAEVEEKSDPQAEDAQEVDVEVSVDTKTESEQGSESKSKSEEKDVNDDPAFANRSRRERRRGKRSYRPYGHLQHRIGERPQVIKPPTDNNSDNN